MDHQFKDAQKCHQLTLGWLFHAFEPISNPVICFITHFIYPIFNLSHRLLTIYIQHMYSACVSQATCLTIVYPKHVLSILPVFHKLLVFLLCLTLLMSFIYPICCLAFYKRTECSQIILKTCYRKS